MVSRQGRCRRALVSSLIVGFVAFASVRPAGADLMARVDTTDEAAAIAAAIEAAEAARPAEFTLAELLPESELYHPDVLAQVMPASARVDQLRADLTVEMVAAADAAERRTDALVRRSAARQAAWAQRPVVDERRDAEMAAEAAADEEFQRLGVFAVDTFVNGEAVDLERFAVDGAMSPLPELVDSGAEIVEERHAAARAGLAQARHARVEAENVLAQFRREEAEASADLDQASSDLEVADQRIDELRPELEQALIGETVRGTDLTLVVIDAYFRAQVSMSERRPSCGITWDQLAGVGLIESRHGTYGGSSVGPDGQTTKQILGPELNGDPFAAISDTDGGAMDGNPIWDHAVGPMQFIPSSWQIYGLDGNGDGELDPHNMYDATLAAAEHLCRGYSGLQNQGTYRAALLGYNQSEVYGSDVIAAQQRYAAAVRLVPTAEGIAEDLERRSGEQAALVGR